MAPDPACAGFDVGALDSRPGYAVRPFLSICFIRMRSVSVIERLAINILSVLGQMGPDGLRQIDIRRIGHLASLNVNPDFLFLYWAIAQATDGGQASPAATSGGSPSQRTIAGHTSVSTVLPMNNPT